jgi:hypothetical protein
LESWRRETGHSSGASALRMPLKRRSRRSRSVSLSLAASAGRWRGLGAKAPPERRPDAHGRPVRAGEHDGRAARDAGQHQLESIEQRHDRLALMPALASADDDGVVADPFYVAVAPRHPAAWRRVGEPRCELAWRHDCERTLGTSQHRRDGAP